MCVVLVSLLATFLPYMYARAQKESIAGFSSTVKEAKDNADIHTTENRRTPQNLMITDELKWLSVEDRVVKFAMYTVAKGDVFLADFISEIESNTCMRFQHAPTNEFPQAESDHATCYIPDFSQLKTEQKLRRFGFQCLLECLGKQPEHQRKDRDDYVQILSENISPGYNSKFQITSNTVTQGLPYDFSSIMQFEHDIYSKNGLSTMIPVDDSIPKESLGKSVNPSQQDYLDIKLTYCGTETAAGPVTLLKAHTTFVSVKWPKPKYSPVKIRVDYQHTLMCDERPYYRKRTYIPVDSVRMNLTDMKPGSLCKLNFVVLYNPSESDRGIDYYFASHQSKPTRPPEDVRILRIKDTSARLSWKAIPCRHQNGMIVGYRVRHDYELPNKTFALQQSETFGNTMEMKLLTLRPNRIYAVQVAGVNQAGVGSFSSPLQLITPGVCPGRVRITSIETSCNNITIQWISPLDENGIPYEVRVKYSFKNLRRIMDGSVVASSMTTSWTASHLNIPSDTSVKFSLEAINKRLKAGPALHTTIRTKKPSYY